MLYTSLYTYSLLAMEKNELLYYCLRMAANLIMLIVHSKI
jgi:hypothetical protein